MDLANLLPLLVIAAVAYYMGYQRGRASLMRDSRSEEAQEPQTPGPQMDHLPGPTSVPSTSRPRSAPPPASAGDSEPSGSTGSAPPRRSSKPPPAAAGLLDKK